MEDADFSDDFCRFLQNTVTTVDAAELLLALAREPERAWPIAELLGRLGPDVRMTEAEAAKQLELFQSRGLVARDAEERVRFHPDSAPLKAHVQALAKAYNQRPVTLIRMIYALRDARIQSFADAFKLRKN
jgi:hypothetical protein